jgi:hypothetical protein
MLPWRPAKGALLPAGSEARLDPMNWQSLFDAHQSALEDFWGRRANEPVHKRVLPVFDRRVRLASNAEHLLGAADYAQPLYSTAPQTDKAPFAIDLIALPETAGDAPLPDNLFDHIRYAGFGQLATLQLGRWGHCHIDLAAGRATAFLAHKLAEQAELVCRYLLNTILTNFMIASGYGFLHATGLVKEQRALLLMAPHNSGKSTSALRLVFAGYALLSDSMIFVDGQADGLHLYGFPVGQFKLRSDMVDHFPQVTHLLAGQTVRGEIKQAADLRQLDPALVHERYLQPSEIVLCLLSLSHEDKSTLRPVGEQEVQEAIMANSLFYDSADVWQSNLAQIGRLLAVARTFHLAVGHDTAGLVNALDALWR